MKKIKAETLSDMQNYKLLSYFWSCISDIYHCIYKCSYFWKLFYYFRKHV